MPYTRRWTSEDEALLRELWGQCTIPTIAAKLRRTPEAVKQRVCKLGLGGCTSCADGVSLYQLARTVDSRCCQATIFARANRWIAAGLPIYHRTVTRQRVRMVRLNAFWRWARKHPELVDFTGMPEGALGMEPKWMRKRRERDSANAQWRYRRWTPHEEAILYALCSDPEHPPEMRALAAQLRRGENSIRAHICRLGLEPPARQPPRRWTNEELDALRTLRAQGCAWQRVANQLGRSVAACQVKYRELEEH